jgi:hypothetical protein
MALELSNLPPEYQEQINQIKKRLNPPKEKSNSGNVTVEQDKDGNTSISGYEFAKDDLASIIAFLFGDKMGEKKCTEIYDNAAKISNPKDRENFIETNVREYAKEKDGIFQDGIKRAFNSCQDKTLNEDVTPPSKNLMLGIMKGMGLNINDDNCYTDYQEGQGGNPKVFTIVWVNRPTENIKNSDSPPRKLANQYSKSLAQQERSSDKNLFDQAWEGHVRNAENGGPNIPKEQFEKEAKDKCDDYFQSACKKSNQQNLKESPHPSANNLPNLPNHSNGGR